MSLQLNPSGVVFDAENHTYFLGDLQLFGITGMISKHLFPDKYANIPERILNNAKERGTLVHSTCELIDTLEIEPQNEEGIKYIKIKNKYNLEHLESEYIVTDKKHFATAIDKVYKNDGNSVFLADIKTTYNLDKDYLSWQLSINAYLFEKQNKGIEVAGLYAIWLNEKRGKYELLEIARKPDKEVKDLLDCEVKGSLYKTKKTEISQFAEAEKAIAEIEIEVKRLSERKKELSDGLLKLMQEHNIEKWKGERISLTRKKAYERESADTKSLKTKFPDIYNAFVNKTTVKESITIKLL